MLKGVLENQKDYYIEYLTSKSKDANIFLRESYNSTDYKDINEYFLLDGENIGIKLSKLLNTPIELYNMNGELISVNYEVKDLQDKSLIKIPLNGNPVYEKIDNEIVYIAPIYDYNEQIGICKIQYNSFKEDQLYINIRKLYFNIAFYSTIIVSIIGSLYFSNITNNILNLNILVENIGKGKYLKEQYFKSHDELEYLNQGILNLSTTIEKNIQDLNAEKSKLETMIQRLKESELEKETFIGNISHEFKTPLTILKIQLDLMSLYQEDEEIFINGKDIMNKEIKRLDAMVENILYLSKIQKYEYQFNKEEFNVSEVLEEIIYRFKYKLKISNIRLCSYLEDCSIFMDKESFLQIFINIIDNAIKYNVENGKVVVSNYLKGKKIFITIENTGDKIDEEDIIKIFEPFYIIEKSRNKKFSGTGLGLPLVKNLIEKQGGSISFHSEYDLNKNNLNIVTVILKTNSSIDQF